MAEYLDRVAQVPAVPGEPHRVRGRTEQTGGLVQVAQHAADRGGTVQAPGARLGELTLDERQHLAAVGVQARADQARGSRKTGVLEVAQQRVHRGGPRPGVTDHNVAPAVDHRPAAA